MKTVFLRALDVEDKAAALLLAIHEPEAAAGETRFEREPEAFAAVPGAPFVYRVPVQFLRLAACKSTLAVYGAEAKQGFGASTRFHRLVWEVQPVDVGAGKRWWLAHGTKPAPFFKPTFHVVLWAQGGAEAKADVLQRYPYLHGNYGFKIQAEDDYGKPGLCYGKRTSRFSVQIMPEGHIFSFEGTAIHLEDATLDIWAILALLNSTPVAYWLNSVCAQHKAYNYVDSLPVPAKLEAQLSVLARQGWRCAQAQHLSSETSNFFTLPALLRVEEATLGARSTAWRAVAAKEEGELTRIQAKIDAHCFALYGIDGKDRYGIERDFSSGKDVEPAVAEAESGEETDEIDYLEVLEADSSSLVSSLLSWCVGVAFGRFDIRLATGEWRPPPEPEPFAPLPVCSPGILMGADGLPLAAPPAGYLIRWPEDSVLVDDPGHSHEHVMRVRAVFNAIFPGASDVQWQEAAELLDPKGCDLRNWFPNSFFDPHIKRYSKSRRKAPIYWQLATPSASYSVWVYYHRFNKDTFYKVLNDYVTPKLQHEEHKLTSLVQTAGGSPTPSQRKEIAEQEAFVEELRVFREEVARIAPLWNPDLNDGVIINFAPLWRLLPQHRAWQKECKDCWDKLVAGEYDWAHLAMHLWPERVVPKCAEDRSLAIAHSLEEVFWIETADGKWQSRKVDKATVDRLIAERTSSAVKDALQSLLSAPALGTSRGTGLKQTSRGSSPRRCRPASANSRPAGSAAMRGTAPDDSILDAVKQTIAASEDGATKAKIISTTELTDSQWNAAINVLLAQGVVTKTGERRAARYHLVKTGGES